MTLTKKKLMGYDFKNIFTERHYDSDKTLLIKQLYKKNIDNYNKDPLEDVYILLKQVESNEFTITNNIIASIANVNECNKCKEKINLFEIFRIIRTPNIYLYMSESFYYISAKDFFDKHNINNLKFIESFINKIIYQNVKEEEVDNEFLKQMYEIIEKFPFQIDHLKIFKMYPQSKLNFPELVLTEPFQTSIVVNTNILTNLNTEYKQIVTKSNSNKKNLQQMKQKLSDIQKLFDNDSSMKANNYFLFLTSNKENNLEKTIEYVYLKINFPIKYSTCKSEPPTNYDSRMVFRYCTNINIEDIFLNNIFITHSHENTYILDIKKYDFPYYDASTKISFNLSFIITKKTLDEIYLKLKNKTEEKQKIEILEKLESIKNLDFDKNETYLLNLKQITIKSSLDILSSTNHPSKFNLIIYNTAQTNKGTKYVDQGSSYFYKSSIFQEGDDNFYLPVKYLYLNSDIIPKTQFLENLKNGFDIEKDIQKHLPKEDGWFFQAFYYYDKKITYLENTYVFVEKSIVNGIQKSFK